MEVQLIKLNKIKVNDKNPRTITEDKLRRLVESILVFPKMLTIRPIVVDDKGVALGGNMRTRALKAVEQNKPVEICCAIGNETVDGRPYSEIVDIARQYIYEVGGFEKFAEWGLIRFDRT